METTRYYLGFNRINGIGPARLERLIERLGSVEAAWHAAPGQLAAAGLDPKLIEALLAARRTMDLDAELARASAAGVRVIPRGHPDYPENVAAAPSPPLVIFTRGRLSPADAWAIAVVGTRSPTTYGRDAAYRLAGDLAQAGVTVVSGLAIGIDTIAHRAALDAGGRTIGVLPCGADTVYPGRNRQLAERIVERGALVSEFPLGLRPTPQLFPVRNRLISALARGVLVVEAGLKSGALITVDFALDQGRDVFAVPGSIFSGMSEGANQLLRSGAGVATSAGEILEALNMSAVDSQRDVRESVPADPAEAAILPLLGYQARHVDEIAREARLAIGAVTATLAVLELKGAVRQAAPMQYVLAR